MSAFGLIVWVLACAVSRHQNPRTSSHSNNFLPFTDLSYETQCFLPGLIWKSTITIIFKVFNLPKWSQTPLPQASLPWTLEDNCLNFISEKPCRTFVSLEGSGKALSMELKDICLSKQGLRPSIQAQCWYPRHSLSHKAARGGGQVTWQSQWSFGGLLALKEAVLHFCSTVHRTQILWNCWRQTMAPQTESCRMLFRNWDGQLVELGSPKKSLLTHNKSKPLSPFQCTSFAIQGQPSVRWQARYLVDAGLGGKHSYTSQQESPAFPCPGWMPWGTWCWAGRHIRGSPTGSLYFSSLPRWPVFLPSVYSCLSSLRKVWWFFVCFVYFLISIFRWKMICKTGKPFISQGCFNLHVASRALQPLLNIAKSTASLLCDP